MRILSWEQLTREDIAFTRIQAARYSWSADSVVLYQGEGRQDNMLFFLLDGHREYRIADTGETFSLEAEELMLMPAGSCYESTVRSQSGASGICLQFTLADANGKICQLGKTPVLLRHDLGGGFRALFESMLACSLQYGSRLRVKALMMELCDWLCDSSLSDAPEELRPAIREMETHLERPLSIDKAAALCHMSLSTFTRHFKEALGESPAAYHRHIRLQKSRELLGSGLYTVEQTAMALGFFDTAHFCRAYAAYFSEAAGSARLNLKRSR